MNAASSHRHWIRILTVAALGLACSRSGGAEIIYDESKVPAYTLPYPLVRANGKPVADEATWWKKRRPELLELFQNEVYGRSPDRPRKLNFVVTAVDPDALGGKAVRKEISVALTGRKGGPTMDLLIYFPKNAIRPTPAFLGLNFGGNHTVCADSGIKLNTRTVRPNAGTNATARQAAEASRGSAANQWQVDMLLAHGYGLVTSYYGDIEPDHASGWKQGIRGALGQGENTQFRSDDWGAIGAWAWGLSRAMDYLERDGDIDARRIALIGHSRLGKTALWAGAQDDRFAVVISNDSGCGGAALSRRCFGETVERINTSFPHWFCGNFKKYNGKEAELPVDQHELIALLAPRPVYVASAEDDRWADPRGEFLAALGADSVYRILGQPGLGVTAMPKVNQPVGSTIGYHIRTGKHDVTAYDWEQYLQFAERHLRYKQ